MRFNKKVAVGLAMFGGAVLGFCAGVSYGIGLCIEQALKIMPRFVEIKINYQQLYDALFLYNNQIAGGVV